MTMTDHGRLADESGYVAVWTVVIGGALMVAGGVVYDSADKANEARRVTMVANEAGRAAAQEITSDAISGRSARPVSTSTPRGWTAPCRSTARR